MKGTTATKSSAYVVETAHILPPNGLLVRGINLSNIKCLLPVGNKYRVAERYIGNPGIAVPEDVFIPDIYSAKVQLDTLAEVISRLAEVQRLTDYPPGLEHN